MSQFRILGLVVLTVLKVLAQPQTSAVLSELAGEAPDLSTTRLPPREQLTEAEYKNFAAQLRATYAKPSQEWPVAHVDPDVNFVELGLVPAPIFPENNPYSKEKAELGKLLFFDPRLSGSGQIACATRTRPHPDLDLAWADGRTTRFGHSRVRAAQRLIGIVVTTTTPREGSDTATPFERSTPLSVRLTTGKPSASAGRSSLK